MELSAIEFFIMKILNTIYPILCLVFREIKKKISNTHSMLVKVLVNGIGYTATQAETIMSFISNWGL